MSDLGPAAVTFEFKGAVDDVDALYQERGWTDGLPVVPPTEARVAACLRWTDRDPREVIGILPPRQGEATVEKIAINTVMAGCKPEYFPVVLTAIEALADPKFNLDSVQATTHPVAPLIVVNGPIARELGINGGYNAFGQGFRANVTIGRAVRLVLMNLGGGLPGTGDRSTQGSPSKIAYCVAENEAENPWEPLHVEHGHPADVSTVTAFGCEAPHNIQDHYSNTARGVLLIVAGSMGQAGSNNLLGRGWPLLSFGPEHAATVAKEGFTKRQVKEFLFEHARYPLAKLGAEYRAAQLSRNDVKDTPEAMVPIVRAPEDISIIVAGGAGKHSSWQPTFGDGTAPTRRVIARRDGTPIRRIADLRR
ncbi:MAG TPA: hypothetical protein VEA38_09840 [Terriglobales bacterium]|nr:hypothetical protein [Terriglobales bacterium]